MIAKLVPTSNVKALARASELMASRAPGQSRIGLISGASGAGKSTAVIALANQVDGVVIEAKPIWTPRWMLADIVHELGGDPYPTSQPMFRWIVESLLATPRSLFVDESDRLAVREILVETLRSIHDATRSPIWLIGMDRFRRRATARPQLARRIAVEVEFRKATVEDALLIARECCEVEIAEEEVRAVHQRVGGNLGLFCNELTALENAARKAGARRASELRAA